MPSRTYHLVVDNLTAETEVPMCKATNLPKWLLSGLGTAVILMSGCLSSHTARDGGLFPRSSTYNSQFSESKSAPKNSSKVTASLSDESASSSVLVQNRLPSKGARTTPVSASTASTGSAPMATASLSDSSPSRAPATETTAQQAPGNTALRPSLPISTSNEQPRSRSSSSADSSSTAVQPASAVGPLPSSPNSPAESDDATPPVAESAPDAQPLGSKLSDFVAPNRLAPRPTTSNVAISESNSAPTTVDADVSSEGDASSDDASEKREAQAEASQGDEVAEDVEENDAVASGDASRNVQASLEVDSGDLADAPWQSHLDRSITALEQQLASTDLDEREQTRLAGVLRLMYVAANRPEEATASLERLPSPQQEFWKQGMAGLTALLAPEGTPVASRQAKLALQHLRDACHELAALASLEVRNLAFCRRVESYGRYTEFEPYEFLPEQEVILYTEVNNFAVEKTPSGFETELLGSYQIFDEAGRHVGDYELPLDKQVCRHIRTDYFLPYRLYLPKTLAAGTYKIQVTMQDRKGHKFGQTEPVEFRIRNE